MARPQKKKKLSKNFKGFYKSNGDQTKERAIYDQQLTGANPGLNRGY